MLHNLYQNEMDSFSIHFTKPAQLWYQNITIITQNRESQISVKNTDAKIPNRTIASWNQHHMKMYKALADTKANWNPNLHTQNLNRNTRNKTWPPPPTLSVALGRGPKGTMRYLLNNINGEGGCWWGHRFYHRGQTHPHPDLQTHTLPVLHSTGMASTVDLSYTAWPKTSGQSSCWFQGMLGGPRGTHALLAQ